MPSPTRRLHALVNARQLHGKELSYNNLLDLDAALACVRIAAAARGGGAQAQQPLRRRHRRDAGRSRGQGVGRRSA